MMIVAVIGVVGLVAAGLLAWYLTAHLRRAARARLHTGAWSTFAELCPEPPAGHDGPAHPLAPPPGPAGEVVVCEDGLCLRLADHPDRTLWLPWDMVRHLSPAEHSGVDVGIAGGLHFQVSALAGRAIWEAQTANLRSGRSGASSGPSSLAPVVG